MLRRLLDRVPDVHIGHEHVLSLDVGLRQQPHDAEPGVRVVELRRDRRRGGVRVERRRGGQLGRRGRHEEPPRGLPPQLQQGPRCVQFASRVPAGLRPARALPREHKPGIRLRHGLVLARRSRVHVLLLGLLGAVHDVDEQLWLVDAVCRGDRMLHPLQIGGLHLVSSVQRLRWHRDCGRERHHHVQVLSSRRGGRRQGGWDLRRHQLRFVRRSDTLVQLPDQCPHVCSFLAGLLHDVLFEPHQQGDLQQGCERRELVRRRDRAAYGDSDWHRSLHIVQLAAPGAGLRGDVRAGHGAGDCLGRRMEGRRFLEQDGRGHSNTMPHLGAQGVQCRVGGDHVEGPQDR
mmetsp:Transcript_29763/g.90094  ORF Transcript_29763/g.90094 Transcript_29763/m.90094 type:complete len:345 (+) Transcript_29763:118-1152(+)